MNTTTSARRLGAALVLILGVASAAPASAGIYEDMLRAVDAGDTGTVTALLQRGMDINTVDSSGNSLLTLAAGNGNLALVDLLLAHRPQLGARNKVGDTALLSAALKDNVDIVRSLLKAGADVDQAGWSGLHYAAFSGSVDISKLLIERGAKVDAVAPNGMTALLLAAKNGHAPMVKLLLESKADPKFSTSDGITALKLAGQGGHEAVVKLLRGAGAKE